MNNKLLLLLSILIVSVTLVSATGNDEICITDSLGLRCWSIHVDFYKEFVDGKGRFHDNFKQISKYTLYGDDEIIDFTSIVLDNFNRIGEDPLDFENSIARVGVVRDYLCIQIFKDGELKFEKCP